VGHRRQIRRPRPAQPIEPRPVEPAAAAAGKTLPEILDRAPGGVRTAAARLAGKLAVATSTGGTFKKLPGRVGDSPLIGCGTYADEDAGVSCTGHGESIIRVVLAKSAADFISGGADPQSAAQRAVDLLANKTGSTGGLIIIDRHGKTGYARNTTRMPVCTITDSAHMVVDG